MNFLFDKTEAEASDPPALRSRNDAGIDSAMADIDSALTALNTLAAGSPRSAAGASLRPDQPHASEETRHPQLRPRERPLHPQARPAEPEARDHDVAPKAAAPAARPAAPAEVAPKRPSASVTRLHPIPAAAPRTAVQDAAPMGAPQPIAPKNETPTAAAGIVPETLRAAAPGRSATPQPAPTPESGRAAPQAQTARTDGTTTSAPIEARAEPNGRDDSRAEPLQARADNVPEIGPVLEADKGPLNSVRKTATGGGNGKPPSNGGRGNGGGGNGGSGSNSGFRKRTEMPNFAQSFQNGVNAVRRNLAVVMAFTIAFNVLVLAIPVYLFQISDRVLTSRSVDTLVMLTIVVVGAVILQAILDAVRRIILMRTAVEVEVQLGAPILSAAARSSLNGTSKDYHVLGDLQTLRSFITSGTLISFLDAPLAPLFILAVYLIHPHLGYIVIAASLVLLVLAMINQKMTAKHFAESNNFLSRATLHLDSMSRNSQIINALAMIPEAVRIWGRDTAFSLRAQVRAQDRNVALATVSRGFRMLTQIAMLGWGAYLALQGEMTGGMVIAGSIIAARALTPIEGAIEGWHQFTQFRASFQRIRGLLQTSPLNFERLLLPEPKGRLDVERILYVPPPNKKVILNGISFSLMPGESLAVIGNSGAGKTTLGKMLVGSILPTSGSVRLDLMDLRNWDPRQFGESIGYLPQDVQLFPGTIKANIGRMRDDASDREIYDAAVLADVHELIASFPQGYETVVAADGAPLSGGQKQRIALARAFFGSPKLVVLDEPNSNLDSPGETALAKALVHAKKQGITVVTITQRTALLNYVDKIIVLNNGSVSMFGERAEVLQALTQGTSKGGGQLPNKESGDQ